MHRRRGKVTGNVSSLVERGNRIRFINWHAWAFATCTCVFLLLARVFYRESKQITRSLGNLDELHGWMNFSCRFRCLSKWEGNGKGNGDPNREGKFNCWNGEVFSTSLPDIAPKNQLRDIWYDFVPQNTKSPRVFEPWICQSIKHDESARGC